MNDLKDQLAKVRVQGLGEGLASGFYCFLFWIFFFLSAGCHLQNIPGDFFFITRYKYSILSAVPLYLTFKNNFLFLCDLFIEDFFFLKTCRGGWR